MEPVCGAFTGGNLKMRICRWRWGCGTILFSNHSSARPTWTSLYGKKNRPTPVPPLLGQCRERFQRLSIFHHMWQIRISRWKTRGVWTVGRWSLDHAEDWEHQHGSKQPTKSFSDHIRMWWNVDDHFLINNFTLFMKIRHFNSCGHPDFIGWRHVHSG